MLENSITHSKPVTNVGFIFDEKLTFIPKIKSIYKSYNISLYKIKSIRKCTSYKTCKILINSLVFSNLDFANLLYSNILKCRTLKMNKIIRSSDRLID